MSDPVPIGRSRGFLALAAKIEAGEPLDELFVTFSCPRCGAQVERMRTRGIPDVPPNPEDRLCNDCVRRWPSPLGRVVGAREAELEAAGVPAEHRRPFIEPAVWPRDPRRQFADVDPAAWTGDPWCVTIAGDVGAGKTYLAAELLWRLLRTGKRGAWYRGGALVTALLGKLGEERELAATRAVYEAEAFVLDELGRGHEGRAWSMVEDLVQHRQEHQLATVITTNRRLKGRADKVDREPSIADDQPAIYRRLETGLVVGLGGKWRVS